MNKKLLVLFLLVSLIFIIDLDVLYPEDRIIQNQTPYEDQVQIGTNGH